jgi:Erv1 / Alr family/Thioredoxin
MQSLTFFFPYQCQHFRSHYIEFAQQVKAIMEEFGVEGPPVQFYAVSCTANRKLCRSLGIKGYPKIKIFAAGVQQNATAEVVYWKLHAFDVLDTLKIQVQHLQLDASKLDSHGFNAKSDTTASNKKIHLRSKSDVESEFHRTKKQVFDDAYLSFDFNLRNAIFVQEGPLSNQTKAALRQWLELVRQTTPVVWQIRTVTKSILKDFDTVVASENNLLKILDQYPPPSPQWSPACTKGVSGMGYSCGLWELFHIMSVGLVEYNLMIGANDDIVLDELSLTTTGAAETIRNFVEYFFACDVCRMNFITAYDACALDRCHRLNADQMDSEQWIQFPIWLYETHNAVNVRLLHEKAQREHKTVSQSDEMQARWPSRKACPLCWLESDGWDEEIVYKYLRTEYWYVVIRSLYDFCCNIDDLLLSENISLFSNIVGRRTRYPPNIDLNSQPSRVPITIWTVSASFQLYPFCN